MLLGATPFCAISVLMAAGLNVSSHRGDTLVTVSTPSLVLTSLYQTVTTHSSRSSVPTYVKQQKPVRDN